MERDFVAELKKVISDVDKIELEGVVERAIEQQPEGPLYALCRCTPSGIKEIVMLGLTFGESRQKYQFYNDKESAKRKAIEQERHDRGLEYIPDAHDLIFFDVIEQEKLEQRSPYYNPKQVVAHYAENAY